MTSAVNGHAATQTPQATPPQTTTFDQLLEWPHENPHVEWVDGRVIRIAPVTDDHADVAEWLQMLLGHWVDERKLGIVRTKPEI
jgi:Uma2 family endonuclease